MPAELTPRSRLVALLQVVLVLGVVFAWIKIGETEALFADIEPPYNLLLHVGIMGASAMFLVVLATWRDRSTLASLGLVRAPLWPTVGWGFATLGCCYVAAGVSALLYAKAADVMHGDPLLGAFAPRGTLARELAKTADWATMFKEVSPGMAVGLAAFVGPYEEILFRGFVLGRLRRLFGDTGDAPRGSVWAWRTVAAIVIGAFVFSLGHVYQGAIGVVRTFALGIVLSLVTVWQRSIWSGIIAHTCVDTLGLILLNALGPYLEQLKYGGE